jgi:hypothetical protein
MASPPDDFDRSSSEESTPIIHREGTFNIPSGQLILNCELLVNDFDLLSSPYRVQSPVSFDSLRLFLDAIKGDDIPLELESLSDLDLLCDEFGFQQLKERITTRRQSLRSTISDDFAVATLATLSRQITEQAQQFAHVQKQLSGLLRFAAFLGTLPNDGSGADFGRIRILSETTERTLQDMKRYFDSFIGSTNGKTECHEAQLTAAIAKFHQESEERNSRFSAIETSENNSKGVLQNVDQKVTKLEQSQSQLRFFHRVIAIVFVVLYFILLHWRGKV